MKNIWLIAVVLGTAYLTFQKLNKEFPDTNEAPVVAASPEVKEKTPSTGFRHNNNVVKNNTRPSAVPVVKDYIHPADYQQTIEVLFNADNQVEIVFHKDKVESKVSKIATSKFHAESTADAQDIQRELNEKLVQIAETKYGGNITMDDLGKIQNQVVMEYSSPQKNTDNDPKPTETPYVDETKENPLPVDNSAPAQAQTQPQEEQQRPTQDGGGDSNSANNHPQVDYDAEKIKDQEQEDQKKYQEQNQGIPQDTSLSQPDTAVGGAAAVQPQ